MTRDQIPKHAELSAFSCECNTTVVELSKPKNLST